MPRDSLANPRALLKKRADLLSVRRRRAIARRQRYAGFTDDYLYPAMAWSGRKLSPTWESTKGVYRRLSPKIVSAVSPVVRAARLAGYVTPYLGYAASYAGYTSPVTTAVGLYNNTVNNGFGAYDALAGPEVTGSLYNAGMHGGYGAYYGSAALANMYAMNPIGAAMNAAYALSHGQRAVREGYRNIKNRYSPPVPVRSSRAYRRRRM